MSVASLSSPDKVAQAAGDEFCTLRVSPDCDLGESDILHPSLVVSKPCPAQGTVIDLVNVAVSLSVPIHEGAHESSHGQRGFESSGLMKGEASQLKVLNPEPSEDNNATCNEQDQSAPRQPAASLVPSSGTPPSPQQSAANQEAGDSRRLCMPPPPPDVQRAAKRQRSSRVVLMHSERYEQLCGLLDAHEGRDHLLYSLLRACGISRHLRVVEPAQATMDHLLAYHDREYLEALRQPPSDPEALEEFGLSEDCATFEGLWRYCCAVAGASLQAASLLARGQADVAMNWGGGRHHAKKGGASGFCYVNDAVLAILHLLKRFQRVLYLDIDVHHSDGVEDAFLLSDRVLHVSLHKYGRGFFPGTGPPGPAGIGPGRGHSLNVGLPEGIGDAAFLQVFTATWTSLRMAFCPQAVVLQCGADCLGGDPLGCFNLTTAGVQACVSQVVLSRLPLLLLGGGGYNPVNTSRLWTILTAAAVGPHVVQGLPKTVPEHLFFPRYGPDFKLHSTARRRDDCGDKGHTESVCAAIQRHASTLRMNAGRVPCHPPSAIPQRKGVSALSPGVAGP